MTSQRQSNSVGNRRFPGMRRPCAILPQGEGRFVAVNDPLKPRTAILPLSSVSDAKMPSNTRTAGPAFQLHDTFPPATVAGVKSPGFPSFSQVAAIPPPSALKRQVVSTALKNTLPWISQAPTISAAMAGPLRKNATEAVAADFTGMDFSIARLGTAEPYAERPLYPSESCG